MAESAATPSQLEALLQATRLSQLRFAPAMEDEFLRHYQSSRAGRVFIIALPLVLFGLAPLYGRQFFNTPEEFLRFVRVLEYGVIVPTLGWSLLATVVRRWHAYADNVLLGTTLAFCLAVSLMTSAGQRVGFYFPAYLPAVFLVAVFVLARLPFFRLVPITLMVLLATVAVQVDTWGRASTLRVDIFAQVVLFTVGAYGGYLFEFTARREWLQRKLLDHLSRTDSLTGLLNRRGFNEDFQRVFGQARRDRRRLTLVALDIDCFKLLNDHYGHAYGDDCLRSMAQALAQHTRRPLDLCARVGGEEFICVFYDCTADVARTRAEALVQSVRTLKLANRASNVLPVVTISAGAVCCASDASLEPHDLVRQADAKLYEAKNAGRNRLVFQEL